MPALLALIPEIIDALAAFIGATWWQLPVLVTLFKVGAQVTEPIPQPAGQQSPVQQAASGAAQAASGVGSAVGGTAQAVGGFGQFLSQNPWLVVGGIVAIFVLRR